MLFSRTLASFLLVSSFCWSTSLAASYNDKTTYSTQGQVATVRRERNLDHWDSDTLAYYLDDYAGYDVAILFYAQWDTNSHTLAPYWDRIATLLDAGNSQSRLIMALFDCELNTAHEQLCQALSISHYPTLLFVGSGPYHDTDPITRTLFGKAKSAGVMGDAPIANTVKFQGNWQYTDAVLDWIRTMQALSNWHMWTTHGFGKRLRNFFWPHGKTPNTPLPIGIPAGKQIADNNSGGGPSTPTTMSSTADAAEVAALQQTVAALTTSTEQLENIALRTATMLESVLLPMTTQDMFTLMEEAKAWTAKDADSPQKEVLRNCLLELGLDYCDRVGVKVASELVNDLEAAGNTMEEMLAMTTLEQDVVDRLAKEEPYCAILNDCILSDMAGEKCRPSTCPFTNPAACSYMTSCLDPELQQAYAVALGLSLEEPAAAAAAGSKKSGWGI